MAIPKRIVDNLIKLGGGGRGKKFELLCKELLEEIGFQNVKLRGGGSQHGRDINACWENQERKRQERWRFECKQSKKTVALDKIGGKLAKLNLPLSMPPSLEQRS